MNRAVAAAVLPLHFVQALLQSGGQTIGAILRCGLHIGPAPQASFVRMGFAPLSRRGAALLGCLISLTPGTTVIDIDMHRRQMLLHVLDARQAAAAVRHIRRRFEPPLRAWFGVDG